MRWKMGHCRWWMVGFAVANLAMSVQGSIIYVDASASGGADDGSSWSDAYLKLQDALAAAGSGDDIYIAAGTYYPDEGSGQTDNDASSTFLMKDGVDLYGGYPAGGGTRSVAVCSGGDAAYNGKPCADTVDCGPGGTCSGHRTKLSGDIDQDDATNCTSCAGDCVDEWCLNDDNAYHVMTYNDADATVVIDGLIVQSGVADGTGPETALDNQGAALLIRASDKYCYGGTNDGTTCTDNNDCTGGGTCHIEYCLSGGPTVKDCLFRHNYADNHAAVNDHASDSSYDNCSFRGNVAAKGGGLLVDNGSPSITDCLFEDNQTNAAPNDGGALWLQGRDDPIGEFDFWGCPDDPAPTITDSTFVGNIADGARPTGGALWAKHTVPFLSSCTFDSNEVKGTGSGYYDFAGGATWIESIPSGQTATITSSLFVGNKVGTVGGIFASGGAIVHFGGPGELNIVNTSFVQNDGRANGGALAVWLDATTTCTNCLFTGNTLQAVGAADGAAVSIWEPPGSGETATVALTNCTVVANQSTTGGTPIGIYTLPDGDSDVSITNCILWDNEPDSDIDDDLASYSIIEGYTSGGTDNNDGPPDFLADAQDCDSDGWGDPPCSGGGCPAGSPDNCDYYGDLRLSCGSLAIDTGDNCALDFDGDGSTSDDVPYDLDGNDRRVDEPHTSDGGNTDCPVYDVTAPMVDRGAYEFACPSGSVCCTDTCVTGDCCDDNDCSGNEICINNTCGCADDDDCNGNQVCCDSTCVFGDCCDDSECTNELCCFHQCRDSECCSNEDCSPFGVCCFGVCQASCGWPHETD